ncbi:sugar transferase [Sporolactobacillus sp. CQH2019]|uniref:sugar transferase n=1 Tax=Sporolactobacillus sp. CQH2019 TaxID=3023512 RepID=UPI002367B853|nr:sugar transferase [Sporolactobacillus sp. CQH2019]MDD9148834.1 sugar transferase [Sporolactobacillus sp. CQH2019]
MAMSKSSIENNMPHNVNIGKNSISINTELEGQKFYLSTKRVIDVCGSLAGLILLSPLLLIISLLIKLEEPKAKVIFKQIRLGKDEKPFNMYKFRSMVPNAEEQLKSLLDKNEASGAMFKIKDDPRVTRLGHFLRKTSMDELPQLVNVLKGDMSLVGPRPPLPREVAEYTDYDIQRLLVTPGCTGLWQVSGRSNLGFDEMVKLDLDYINRRSFLMDIQIIFRTIWLLFGSRDAF